MEQRRDVYLIFKEAINNLLKYSNCTKAVIEIDIKNRQFSLFISDNGVGFDPQQSTFRNGLKNMTSRATKLKGKLKIDSAVEEGTRILLTFMV
jgi:signal transduction histidine kinase